MGTTPIYHFRYPEPQNPADGPTAFRNLAEDVEGVVKVGIVTGNTPEITLSGIGVAGNVLTAKLTGKLVGSDGVARPIPFAIATVTATAKVINSTGGTAVVTYPSGRFTKAPMVVAITSGANYYASINTGSLTSINVAVRHYQGVTDTIDVGIQAHAIQMTATGNESAVAFDLTGLPILSATCHTSGCGNEGITLQCPTQDRATPVVCGVCGQDILDVSR